MAKSIRDLPGVGPRVVFKRDLKPPHRKLWGEPTDRKHRPAAQFLAGSHADYGDDVLSRLKRSRTAAILLYPMAPDPTGLPATPERKDIVLALAWITPADLRVGTNQVVQFRARNSALAKEAIVPAE